MHACVCVCVCCLHDIVFVLAAGRVGGQFWSVYVSCALQGADAVQTTLEQIDLVKRMVAVYPDTFAVALSSADVRTAFKQGKIASLMGVFTLLKMLAVVSMPPVCVYVLHLFGNACVFCFLF